MDELRETIEIAARVGARRDQVVRRGELLRAGASRKMVEKAIKIGHLKRVLHGIYLVGADRLTQRQLHRVTLLRAGAAGGLTGQSGLEPREVLRPRDGVAVGLTRRSRAAGVHQTLLPMVSGRRGIITLRYIKEPCRIETVSGLALAPVGTALADLVDFGDGWLLDRAWKEAEYRGLLNADSLQSDIERRRSDGAARVADLLATRRILTDPSTDLRGKTELPWLHLMMAAGLPMPEVNAPVTASGRHYFADFLWIKYGVALELDSPDHLTPVAAARDHARDADFDSVGIHTLRFIDALALADPEPHLQRVRDTLARRGWRPG